MDIREMRRRLGNTQSEFATRYNIPFRTVQNWETGIRKPPKYIISLLEHRVEEDLINRKTISLPKYDAQKQDLPKRSAFIGARAWLRAVQECIGEPIVFALDDALMCQGNFNGRNDEYLVWLYGSDAIKRFNGVVVLGNQISPHHIERRDGFVYTNFSRTLFDALANEAILDMQGITEALSRYYSLNKNDFTGIFVTPEYQTKFERLANEAKDYYKN